MTPPPSYELASDGGHPTFSPARPAQHRAQPRTKHARFLAVSLVLASSGAAAARGSAPACATRAPVVETALGRLCGLTSEPGAEVFLGVRFARQPKRFGLSTPDAARWRGTRRATQRAPQCWAPREFPCLRPQPRRQCLHEGAKTGALSEDCLFLDVYRPAHSWRGGAVAEPLLPVLVWIHGGGMVTGSSYDVPGHDFGKFAATEQVIVVAVNYRLGPLGFLASPELAAESGGRGSGGTNGLRDQVVALRWVREHISAFGGSRDHITLGGQSAGALSACSLLFAREARGLFSRAVLHSGPCTGPWRPGSEVEGFAVARRAMRALGARNVAELRALPPEHLLWSQSDDSYDIEFPGYWLDGPGGLLPRAPGQLLAAGARLPVEALLLGATSRDGVASGGSASYMPLTDFPNTTAEYAAAMAKHWRRRNSTGGLLPTVRTLPAALPSGAPLWRAVAEAYDPKSPGFDGVASAAHKAADGDYNVVCPSRDLAKRAGVSAYLYYFTHGPMLAPGCEAEQGGSEAAPRVRAGWANHGAELPLLGPPPSGTSCPWEAPERRLSRAMMCYWGQFVRAGTPNGGRGGNCYPGDRSPRWETFGERGGALRLEAPRLQRGMDMVVPDFGRAPGQPSVDDTVNCDFWDSLEAPPMLQQLFA